MEEHLSQTGVNAQRYQFELEQVRANAVHGWADQTIIQVEEQLRTQGRSMQAKKESLRRCISDALLATGDPLLQGCRLEVVGSSSWGGDVPQSDLDLVILTPDGSTEPCQAMEVLRSLQGCCEANARRSSDKCMSRIGCELIEARRVPILRLRILGLSCDISVDQHHSLELREFFKNAVEDSPNVKRFIKLVKYWLYQRRIPLAAEGGIASVAWSIVALRLAERQPPTTTVESLLGSFFCTMQRLGEENLRVQHSESDSTSKFNWTQPCQPEEAWADDWVQLLDVDDPTRPSHSLTPQCVSSALGAFCVAEIRRAWMAIRQGLWPNIWSQLPQATSALPSMIKEASSSPDMLHVILQNGVVNFGRLQEIRCGQEATPGAVGSTMHRRDTTSRLIFEQCQIDANGRVSRVLSSARKATTFECQPCNWVFAVTTSNMQVLPSCFSRILEVSGVVHMQPRSPLTTMMTQPLAPAWAFLPAYQSVPTMPLVALPLQVPWLAHDITIPTVRPTEVRSKKEVKTQLRRLNLKAGEPDDKAHDTKQTCKSDLSTSAGDSDIDESFIQKQVTQTKSTTKLTGESWRRDGSLFIDPRHTNVLHVKLAAQQEDEKEPKSASKSQVQSNAWRGSAKHVQGRRRSYGQGRRGHHYD